MAVFLPQEALRPPAGRRPSNLEMVITREATAMITPQHVIEFVQPENARFPDHFIVEHVCPSCGVKHTTQEPFLVSSQEWIDAGMDPLAFNIQDIESEASWDCPDCWEKTFSARQQEFEAAMPMGRVNILVDSDDLPF